MIYQRNRLLGLRIDSPTINVYQDLHEGDGDTYWEKKDPIYKKRIKDIYIPRDTKLLIVNTINNFFASKKYYKDHGITHNLKILLYSPPACGKDSIARMIASEYNRNLYYVNGGKGGKFVPEAIQSNDSDVNYPLFLISDIDKYPFLITDTNVNLDEEDNEDRITNKLLFGKMINALDGILSGEDRIIVMTTNYIEKFSPVFLRSGRINLLLEIGYVTSEVFRKYVYDFYGEILPKNIKLNNDKLTIAELQFDVVFLKLSFDEFVKKYVE
jgi:chaperone BCS1